MRSGSPSVGRTVGGAVGAFFGLIGLSVVAGVLVTAMVAPALAVTGIAANGSIGMFENLPEDIQLTELAQRSEIYAQQGDGTPVLLAGVYDQNREEVAWEQISQYVKDAVISVEDPRFYTHGGIDVVSAGRAALQNAVESGGPGASTISMQYVRNILIQKTTEITDEAERKAAFEEATATSVSRKLREMKLAIGLEKAYTKDQILLGYLNISNFGGTVYGIQAAAQYYFGLNASDVSLAQAASLVAMVNEPNGLRIDIEENIADNQARRDKDILPAMLREHRITQAQYDEAIATPVTPNIQVPSTGCRTAEGIGAGYFCDYVTNIIKNDPAFGDSENARWEKFKTGGYQIYTTLDVGLQQVAWNTMHNTVPKVGETLYLGSSLVTVQPHTGKILAMTQNTDFNDADDAQPGESAINYSTDQAYGGSTGFPSGSTYKVFTLAEWLKNGHAIGDMVNGNVRTFNLSSFKNSCDGPSGGTYSSRNDGSATPGNMTVTAATAGSVNNAFLSMAQKLDMCEITKTAEAFGMHRADGEPMKQNVAGVLGTNEVAPLSVAAAYAAIAAGGLYCNPVAITRIVDSDGADVPVPQSTCTQAVAPNVAAAMAVAMKAVVNGGTGGPANPGDGIPLIGKTGTSDGEKHTWFAGATTSLATAVWVGNVEGDVSLRYTSESGTNAGTLRFGLWREYMAIANASYGGENFGAVDNSLINGVQVAVPVTRGMSMADAQALIESLGFTFQDGGAGDSDVSAGLAASSTPAGGETVVKGSTVTVYSSNGSQTAVPTVAGQQLGNAANTLISAGFAFGGTKQKVTDANCDTTKALETEPAAGTSAARGSAVVIVVCKKP